jgi:general secretion pathway protein D
LIRDPIRIRWIALPAALLLGACAPQMAFRDGTALIRAGDTENGLRKIEEAVRLEPGKQEYRATLVRERERAVQRLLIEAEAGRQRGDNATAAAAYRRALAIDPTSARAKLALETLEKEQRHQALLTEAEAALNAGRVADAQVAVRVILEENRQHRGALDLQRRMSEVAAPSREPALSAALKRPVTMEFRDADLRTIFELISRSTGINFFFDKDLKPDLRTTVFVRNTSIEDVIRFILVTNQLERKILNENTLLIYPNTPQKAKEYQELVTKSFYLAHADAKQTAAMIKSMVKTRDIHIDEKLRLVVIRDTPDAVRMAEKLIAAQDIPESEVMLEVEVLEVASNVLTDLGIRYPDQVSVAVVGASGTPGTLTLPEIQNRSSALYRISVTNPLLVLNLKESQGRTNTLANPRIRVKDGQKARIHIGDRVPVITTTLTATSFVAESVSYLDVGLKLEVEPTISLNNEVGLKMALEVSNIVQEIRSGSGSLTYQLGTRNASTVLHLRDGETQILAGLISDDERKSADRIPGLGRLPIIGRLFSSEHTTATKTEIVLLITPRILRSLARPDAQVTEFMSGTDSAVGAPPLVLRSVTAPAAAPSSKSADAGPLVLRGAAPAAAPPAPTPLALAPAAVAPPAAGTAPASAPIAAHLTVQAPKLAKLGEEFAVSVDVAGDAQLRAGTFELNFDEARLRIVKVDEGDLLRKSPRGSSFNYNIQEEIGRLTVSYAAPEVVAGTENLAKVIFRVIAPGSARIGLANVAGEDSAGRPLGIAAPAPASVSVTR